MTTACVNDLRQLCPVGTRWLSWSVALCRLADAHARCVQNFKYIVTCFVKQRKGAGLEMNR